MVRIYFTKKDKINSVDEIKDLDDMVERIHGNEFDPEMGLTGILEREFPEGYIRDTKTHALSFETAIKHLNFKYKIEFRKGGK